MTTIPTLAHPTGRPNYTIVGVGSLTICFSYLTPIAFHVPEHGFVRRPNTWGPTTGRHFNEFSDHYGQTLESEQFEQLLEKVTNQV